MKKLKRRQSLCVLLILMLLLGQVTFANDQQKIKERELEEVNQQIKAKGEELNENMNLQNDVARKMRATEQSISQIESEIDYLEDEINIALGNIKIKEAAIDITNAHLVNKTRILNKRLRAMYKVGDIAYLEVLLGSENFEDLLTRVDMVQTLVKYDQNLIAELERLRKRTLEQKVAIDLEKTNLDAKKNEQLIAKASLESKYVELRGYKAQLATEHAAMQELQDQMVKEAKAITTFLENLKLQQQYAGGDLSWPSPGYTYISSYFGSRVHPIYGTVRMHTGIDIPMDSMAEVKAANNGVVIYADWYGGYGKLVMVDHGGGIVTLYGHNGDIVVKVGQKVLRGQTIAKAGSTGDSTGIHCHFEVRKNGKYTDPMPFLKGQN